MNIRSFKCKRFAGLKDKEIQFEEGLNVLLGPNEAGKSTIVEGIFAALFKSSRLKYNNNEDKEFRSRFMPFPDGDTMDAEVVIRTEEGDYSIHKEWGAKEGAQLLCPTGQIINHEDNMEGHLKEILRFGQGTYENIVFAKQRDMKKALESISGNKEIANEIGTFLRKAIMEMDGVSIDGLMEKIDSEINLLFKKWDLDKNYPEANRGIHNPYKIGYGEILDCFYKKESTRLAMEGAQKAEKSFEQISENLKELKGRIQSLKEEKEAVEKFEENITIRLIEEPKLDALKKEILTLGDINREWPKKEQILIQYEKEFDQIKGKINLLENEKEISKKLKEMKELQRKLTEVDIIHEKTIEIQEQIENLPQISKEEIKKLDSYQNNLLRLDAVMKAGVLFGKINKIPKKEPLTITKDLEEPEEIFSDTSFTANGYLKIEYGDHFEIEIKSGEFDYQSIREEYIENKNFLHFLLKGLGALDLEDAKHISGKIEELHHQCVSLKDKEAMLLGEETYDQIKKKLGDFGDVAQVRDLERVEEDLKELYNKKLEILSATKVHEENLRQWVEKYQNHDHLLNLLVEAKTIEKSIENKMETLPPLPQQYENAHELKKALIELRKSYDDTHGQYNDQLVEYYEIEKKLPSFTYEELSKEYILHEEQFEKKLERGRKLLKVRESFQKVQEEMDQNSFAPLIQTFSKYIKELTQGNYNVDRFGDDFSIDLKRDDFDSIPLYLLSSGTYDVVALALRLSILEYIYEEEEGIVILDDCLVDLDPVRKESAIRLIKIFAKRNQVIFTTCNPKTRDLLGGNCINL